MERKSAKGMRTAAVLFLMAGIAMGVAGYLGDRIAFYGVGTLFAAVAISYWIRATDAAKREK